MPALGSTCYRPANRRRRWPEGSGYLITFMHLLRFLYKHYVLVGSMSTSSSPNVERTIEQCRPEDVTPVALEARALDSTAPEYLRDLKRELNEQGYFPARLTVATCFEESCPLETQEEIDRIRGLVRAAAFLGVATVTVEVEAVDDEATVEPALEACVERARRDGVRLDVEGSISVGS